MMLDYYTCDFSSGKLGRVEPTHQPVLTNVQIKDEGWVNGQSPIPINTIVEFKLP